MDLEKHIKNLVDEPRRARARAVSLNRRVTAIADIVAQHPDGIAPEQIAKSLGVSDKLMWRPLSRAVNLGLVLVTGHAATRLYFPTRPHPPQWISSPRAAVESWVAGLSTHARNGLSKYDIEVLIGALSRRSEDVAP